MKKLGFVKISIGIIVGFILILPRFLPSYWAGICTEALIFGIFALSLDLIMGYTGLPSLGHSACFGTAAYVVAILGAKFGCQQQALNMFFGVLSAALLHALLGLVILRTRGLVFLMITLAYVQCLWAAVWKWTSVTGGDDGLSGISRPNLEVSWWTLANPHHFYFFVLLFFILAIVLQYMITRSPTGHTLVGIRENEPRMRALGYNVWLHKYIAFTMSGTLGGLAGCLMVWYTQFASTSLIDISQSANVLLMVVLGGTGTLLGPLLGATIVVFTKNVAAAYTGHWLIVMGIIYVLTIMYMPRGLAGWLKQWSTFFQRIVSE